MGLERYEEMEYTTNQDFSTGRVRRVKQVKATWKKEGIQNYWDEGVLTIPTEEVMMIREAIQFIWPRAANDHNIELQTYTGCGFEVCLRSMGWVIVMCKDEEDKKFQLRVFELMLQEKGKWM